MTYSMAHLDAAVRDATIRAQNAGLPRRYLDDEILLRVLTRLGTRKGENVEAGKRDRATSCRRCQNERDSNAKVQQ